MASAIYFLAIALLVAASECAAMNKVPFHDCGSKKGLPTAVKVSAKYDGEVHLKKGTNVSIEVDFKVDEDVSKATAKVYGNIHVEIPFPLPNPDGCKDSNLVCPLKKGGSYSYKSAIFVKKIYPSLKLVVLWELLDQNNDMIWCIAIPAEIES